ncbi:cytochrome P450 [Collybia nuda]|uniref:Cytochrome P450 n=1 Tax=Collybia nuda TaxID=64659 RepID=A0A9P5Y9P7_9AGAR|nr:cytochrome P450 [Collybia nuda]
MAFEIYILSACLAIGFVFWISSTKSNDKFLPPGPPTLPVIGNLHNFPNMRAMHLKLAEWAQEYGDVFKLKVASNTMVILSSAAAIHEIVDKTGWIASSRPAMYFVKLYSGDYHLLPKPDSPSMRAMRSAVSQFLSKQNLKKQLPLVVDESTQLLYELMERPEDFVTSARRFTHSIAKTIAYGQRAPFFDGDDVIEYYRAIDGVIRLISPGTYPPVDIIPILKYLPEWLAPWKAVGRDLKARRARYYQGLYRQAMENSRRGELTNRVQCFVEWLTEADLNLDREFISYNGLVLVDGGSDTTVGYVLTLMLALASMPECQSRAQSELDSITRGKIPQIEDLQKMPYVNAFMQEILRLRPPVPTGIPHSVTQDIHHKGYVIPKNCTLIINTYAITNDPNLFDRPNEFLPERYLQTEYGTAHGAKTDGYRDSFAFGGGRRLCPGQWLARATMELTTMRLLWAFEFSGARDKKTNVLIPSGLPAENFELDIVSKPAPFTCDIKVRSPERRIAIRTAFSAALDEMEKYEMNVPAKESDRLAAIRESLME